MPLTKICAILTLTSLAACGSVPQKAAAPIVDNKALTLEQQAHYSHDLAECRLIQERATKVSLFDVLSSSDVHADERRRADKASAIVRSCLQGRGYAVLF